MQTVNTIADYLENNISKGRFVYEIETGAKKSFGEIYETACRRVSGLALEPGSVVSVVLPNSIEYVEYFIASMLGGWVFNPLPYFTQSQELGKILSYVTPSLLVTDREDIKIEYSEKYNVLDQPKYISEPTGLRKVVHDPEIPAALYYSSGTTGNPKGVLYSHKNMVSLISSIIRGFSFTDNDKQLAFLPFGHTASINYNILPALMVGCDLYISKGFENLRGQFFKVLSDYKITYTEIVPTVLFMLNKLNVDISNLDLSSVGFIGCGSSSLPLGSQIEFTKKYKIPIANLYGLSETGPSHVDDPRKPGWSPGSIGKPLDVNECKIAKDGEILLKGDNVFVGYYKNMKLYDEVIKDGWFYTGDLGEERDGKCFFIDRKKDLIIRGGINIVPMEVEEVIYGHPEVLECAVVGMISKLHGEEIAAVIVTKNINVDKKKITREVLNICKQNLSSYKSPKKIYFWESIPKTPSKKIMRRKVGEAINAELYHDPMKI